MSAAMPTTRLERWMAPRLERRHPHVAVVLTEADGPPDKLNVPTKMWLVGNKPIRVFLQRSSGIEVVAAPGKVVIADYLVFGPIDPPYTSANRLRINGRDYELLDVDPEVSTRTGPKHSQALAREITPGIVG